MKQVININFQGRVVPIEVSAYDLLKQYIESLQRHFAMEEGKDEIINDIESRIGELFQERIKLGATCIEDADVEAIIKSIGRPEDFDDSVADATTEKQRENKAYNDEANYTNTNGKRRLFRDENHKLVGGVCSGIANYFDIDIVIVRIVFLVLLFSFGIGFIPYIILWIAVPSSATTVIGSRRKKLYRDNEDKYIAGVCSGISHYLGINVWIPRLVFLLPILSIIGKNRWFNGDFGDFNFLNFSPGALFIYVILWLVLPEAKTTAEKLEMKGEKVDLNSIKDSVIEEMKGVQQRVQKFGNEAAVVAADKSRVFGKEASNLAKKGGGSIGDIIVFIVKAFAYTIIGIVSIALIVALFFAGITSIGVFPYKDYLLTDGMQNWLAWGTLLFFIIAPMLGVITWIIRKLAKIKAGSKLLRYGFGAMWIIGWICAAALVASVVKDFRAISSPQINEEVFLSNPGVKNLEVTNYATNSKIRRGGWFNFEPFSASNDDTAFIKNTNINIAKSNTDSFRVTIERIAYGGKTMYADSLARLIQFNVTQQDSLLVLDKGFSINKFDKFRNQQVSITIYVPVGKQIKINNMPGFYTHFNIGNYDDGDYEFFEHGWKEDTWYKMTANGLYTLDGTPAKDYDYNFRKRKRVTVERDGEIIEDYETNGNDVDNKKDSLNKIIQKSEKKLKDSLTTEKEKLEKQIERIEDKQDETAYSSEAYVSPFKYAMVLLPY